MSLFTDNTGGGHVSIEASGPVVNLLNGPFTIAYLHKFNVFEGSTTMWTGIGTGFNRGGIYFDGEAWYSFNFFDTDISNSPDDWHWVVATRAGVVEPVRIHAAYYAASGDLTWVHGDCNGNSPALMPIDRISIGDEFGGPARGSSACISAYNVEMSDAEVEDLFVRSSSELLAADPIFFIHWPQAGGVQFDEIASGGGVVPGSLTGTWDMSADPPGYDFALTPPRTGGVKIDGVSYPVKVWDGSAWVEKPVKGWDGTDWVLGK